MTECYPSVTVSPALTMTVDGRLDIGVLVRVLLRNRANGSLWIEFGTRKSEVHRAGRRLAVPSRVDVAGWNVEAV